MPGRFRVASPKGASAPAARAAPPELVDIATLCAMKPPPIQSVSVKGRVTWVLGSQATRYPPVK